MRTFAITRLLFVVVLISILPVSARGQCVTYTGECLLPSDCVFPLVCDNGAWYGASWITGLSLGHESPCTPYPPLGSSTDLTFDAYVGACLTVVGISTSHGVSGMAQVTVRYTTLSDDGVTKDVDVEIVSMDVSGGTFPPGVLLRQSPTLASGGPLASQAVAGGGRLLHADFDLFTELSVDGGQTWTPASDPLHMVYYQSLPVKPSTWGSLKATYR